MIYVSKINCKMPGCEWSRAKCLTCEHFTCQKTERGWTCDCALNMGDERSRYHFVSMWQTELCIMVGTMNRRNRPGVRISQMETQADNSNIH
jgi:hypothetical protein